MADLEDIADDVPAREDGKILKGGASAYTMEGVLDTNFSGAGGLPQNNRTITIDAGKAVDTDAAGMRTLLEVYECNVSDTPVSGESIGVNTSGQLEGGEALSTDLSTGKYTKGKILRADGTNFTDQALGLIHAVTGTSFASPPDGSLGAVPDIAIDHAAGITWVKTGVSTWIEHSGGLNAHAISVAPVLLGLTLNTLTPVQWDQADRLETGGAWTYNGDHSWTPPADGTYEVHYGLTHVKSTTGTAEWVSKGYWDLTGSGGQVQWGGALDLASITGDNTTAGHAETGFASVKSFLVDATTSTKIMIQTFAKSSNQSVLNGAGFFTAKRIAA